MGIMMLTSLSILGMTDILEMNALTSLFGMCINGTAAVLFILAHMVYLAIRARDGDRRHHRRLRRGRRRSPHW